MAIPVYLQQFKAAGIYRVVFDKSTISNVDTEILRLVVGYSEKGPFNIPTYVQSVTDFKAKYGGISKKLEKRGIFFHRLAIQALASGPILVLNLKKFANETVTGATINTDFNPVYEPIDTVKLKVEDIYDTSRFWELSAENLNGLKATDGSVLDQYINICTTDTVNNSASYFIRKASGTKINGYDITVTDWYASESEEMPEYLEPYKNSLISDFFAEIYVFSGKFSASQVLSSSTLKNYFEASVDAKGKPQLDDNGEIILKLKNHVTNAFNDSVDTLDALYNDETSGALGHYVGCLIPYFKSKMGAYEALNIKFNNDIDTHHMMMSFNVEMLEEEGSAVIDLSGRLSIPSDIAITSKRISATSLQLSKLFAGTATTTLLGNSNATVITDKIQFGNSICSVGDDGKYAAYVGLTSTAKKIQGTLVVSEIVADGTFTITLTQVGTGEEVTITLADKAEVYATAVKLGAAKVVDATVSGAIGVDTDEDNVDDTWYKLYADGFGTMWTKGDAFINTDDGTLNNVGPETIITSIARIEQSSNFAYKDEDTNMKVSFEDVSVVTESIYADGTTDTDSVYGSSVSFIPWDTENWDSTDVNGASALVSTEIYYNEIFSVLHVGDCLLADDGSTDRDNDGEVDEIDNFLDNVYVQDMYTDTDEEGNFVRYVIKLSGAPLSFDNDSQSYLVRIDKPINQEIGTMIPGYLKGYKFENAAPKGTGMYAKLQWQELILSALTDYKGLRTGLLNKSDIDYRYIVDTFETFVENSAKSVLSYLAKEKQSAFAILNFPAVKTFVKCPYTSFTDSKGVFNVSYIKDGYNKKKSAAVRFCLPSDADGASFCAFYSPLKFSDGYVDSIIPSAGLVSNLFVGKYSSRQPYYIIAGPNYGAINATNLVGPDYNYSQEELNIIEPYGVNCMVYRPNFGTFINANQTAKQTPVSALSKVNVRELVIYLQDEIEKVLQAFQWEFNNATTRNAILDKANFICSNIQANGGIQTYLNVMDESNNTPEIIDNEMAVLSTHIEPGMGCGKMVQELTLYRTGQMAAAIND